MKIYISIPISGLDQQKVRERADMIKARLSREGYTPVSPFEIYAGTHPTYADCIAADVRALVDCDAIYMCHGWRMSCGCTIEHGTAVALKQFRNKNFKILYEQ